MIEKVIFKGGNTLFMNGIPARDLSPSEWESVDPDLKQAAIAIGLYEVIEVSSKKSAKKED